MKATTCVRGDEWQIQDSLKWSVMLPAELIRSSMVHIFVRNFHQQLKHIKFCCTEGELDMANPRHVFKAEGNAWLQQLEDQMVLGKSHVFEYIKTDGYKRSVKLTN